IVRTNTVSAPSEPGPLPPWFIHTERFSPRPRMAATNNKIPTETSPPLPQSPTLASEPDMDSDESDTEHGSISSPTSPALSHVSTSSASNKNTPLTSQETDRAMQKIKVRFTPPKDCTQCQNICAALPSFYENIPSSTPMARPAEDNAASICIAVTPSGSEKCHSKDECAEECTAKPEVK